MNGDAGFAEGGPPHGMHSVPSGFKNIRTYRGLQAAFDEYRAHQERSMVDFIDAIATFCENQEDNDVDVVASTIRKLDVANALSKPGAYCDEGASDMQKPIAVAVPNEMPIQRVDRPPLADRPSLSLGNASQANRGSVRSSTVPSVAEDVKADFIISPLDFIDESGEMVRKPSKLVQCLGPTLQRQLGSIEKGLVTRWKPMTGGLAQVVRGVAFQALGNVVIALNFFFIIVKSDHRVANLNQGDTQTMVIIGYFFTAYYTLELFVNLAVLRADFFVGPDWGWNFFDAAIVAVAIFETISTWLGVSGMNTSFLRILRFMKMSRVLRMFSAMRALKEIKMMVEALTGCLVLFIFSSILLVIFISVFAIFFVQGIAGYLEEGPDLDSTELDNIMTQFGSITQAMLTLYFCITGGTDWGEVHYIVNQSGVAYGILFLVYINFSVIAFLNVVVGMFCEKAVSLASVPTTEELLEQRLRQQEGDATDLLALLHVFGTEDGAVMSTARFEEFIAHHDVISYFEVRGVKPSSIRRIFTILCEVNETNSVDYRTFVSTIVKLDGLPSALDLHAVSCRQLHANHVQKKTHSQHYTNIMALEDSVKCDLQEVKNTLREIAGYSSATVNAQVVPTAEFDDDQKIRFDL